MLLGTGSGSGISRFIHIALLVTGVHSKLQEVLKSEQDTEALAKRFADRTSYTYMQNNDTRWGRMKRHFYNPYSL